MGVTADDIRQHRDRVEKEAPPLSDQQARDVAVLLSTPPPPATSYAASL